MSGCLAAEGLTQLLPSSTCAQSFLCLVLQVWGSVGVSQASRIIEMMTVAGVKPDITSFNCLLNAYAQAAVAGQLYQVY